MTSRPIRPPSPPPADDTRVPSPIRPASPPAPDNSPVRRDAPEIFPTDPDPIRPSDVLVEPAAPSMGPSVTIELPSTPAVPTVAPSSAEKIVIPAPSASLTSTDPKGSVPTSEAQLPAGVSSKERRVIAVKTSSQKSLAGTSQPSIAEALRKGAVSAKGAVTSATGSQLALHKSPATVLVGPPARGKVLTRTASGNSLGALVEFANNWNAADQFEGNPVNQPFQLSDISGRFDQAAQFIIDTNKMNAVIVLSPGLKLFSTCYHTL
jgi:hypothetical protein